MFFNGCGEGFAKSSFPRNFYFLFPLNMREAIKPKIRAAEIPAAAEARGPVRAPSKPCEDTLHERLAQ